MLRAPIFHYTRDAIEAHLTVVSIANAVARDLQERTRLAIKRLVKTLLPCRSTAVEISRAEVLLLAHLDEQVVALLQKLRE